MKLINFKKYLLIPEESGTVETWKIILLWILRAVTFVVSIRTIFLGDWELGAITFLTFVVLTAPGLITIGKVKDIPIEIEIMLFIMVVIQFVLGEIGDLYYTTPYFDKFVHFTVPFLMASVSFLLIFSMRVAGRLQASRITIAILVILITMGIGGIWEIIEYAIDLLRKSYFTNWVQFQGSLVEDPYYDTMNDLLADFVGGILGAIYTYRFMTDTKDFRTQELIKDVRKQILHK